MKTLAIIIICAELCACATTEFYSPTGKPVARFQGDMPAGTSFSYLPTGAITWTAGAVNHSAATLAAGTATAGAISAAGTAAAVANLHTLLK